MLNDYGNGILEFRGQAAGRFQIDEIVVRKFFALELFGCGQTFRGAARRHVQSRSLVGIFSVTQFLPAPQSEVHAFRQHRFR